MSKKIVTIYVNDYSIRLMAASNKDVKLYAELPTPPDSVRDGVILNEEAVAEEIRMLLKANKISDIKVIAGLSGLHTVSRVITLPRVSKALLEEAIVREAERVMPVPLETFHLSWQVLSGSGNEMQVFVAASPKAALDAMIRTLHQARLEPYMMDLAPLALARAVDNETAILLNVQSGEVDIVLIVDRIPWLAYSVYIPGEDLSLETQMPAIAHELERTMRFYQSNQLQTSEKTVSLQIFASGDLALDPGSVSYLNDKLQHRVLLLESPLEIPETVTTRPSMINIGLAMKELSGNGNSSLVNLNVLPVIYKPKTSSVSQYALAGAATLLAGLLIPAAILVQGAMAQTSELQDELNETNRLLGDVTERYNSEKKEYTQLEKDVSEIKVKTAELTGVYDDLKSRQGMINGDLDTIESRLTDDMALINVTHEGTELVVEVVSTNEDAVFAYAIALRESQRFSPVIISTIEEDCSGLSCTLNLTPVTEG